MIKVDSSCINAVEYRNLESELVVLFNSGDTYTYFGVPKTVYSGLIRSRSKGRYLNSKVKGKFEYRKV